MAETIPPPPSALEGTHCTAEQYEALYRRSLADPDGFWGEQAARLDWVTAPTKVGNWSYDPVAIRWFEDGVLNLCHNAVDRHLPEKAKDPAIVWVGDEPGVTRTITYGELKQQVNFVANALLAIGVRKGDRVTIYLPMIPEAAFTMLACARIGAIHSVVFGGFSPEALAGRIQDCGSRHVVTADGGMRGGRVIPLKANVDEALKDCPDVHKVLVFTHLGNEVARGERDQFYEDLRIRVEDVPCEPMSAEDPLFIL